MEGVSRVKGAMGVMLTAVGKWSFKSGRCLL